MQSDVSGPQTETGTDAAASAPVSTNPQALTAAVRHPPWYSVRAVTA